MSILWMVRLAALAALALALTWLHHHIYKNGWDDRELIATTYEAKVKALSDAADALAAANLKDADAKIDSLQITLATSLSQISADHKKEIDHANSKIATLNRDVADGKLRLSIATSFSSCNPAQESKGAGIATGDSNQGRAELLPETAESLISIAAGGDAAVRRANACVDAYNSVKVAIDAQ